MGPGQRPPGERAWPHPGRRAAGLRQGARLSLAAALTREHPWLVFVEPGTPGEWHGLDVDTRPWQEALVAQNARWYAGVDAPQVAAAFVLQYLLQVPAHTLGYAAGLAPAAGLPVPEPSGLAFTLGPNHVPDRVLLGSQTVEGRRRAALGRAERLLVSSRPSTVMAEAERAYRAVAEPLAAAYPAIAKLGSGTRAGMVSDMWRQAVARGRAVERESCCFLYVLPGCHECAGCPRLPQR